MEVQENNFGNRENIFDKEFRSKLKAFYTLEEPKKRGEMGHRATGRTTILAKIILETAIESGEEVVIQDHYIYSKAYNHAIQDMKRNIYQVAEDYRGEGVILDMHISQRGDKIRARIIEGHQEYEGKRYSIFPIKELKEQSEFLKKRKLLLL